MATVVKLGPADHGRPMTLDEYVAGDYEGGYQYELIDGRLYVAPLPDLPQNRIEGWLGDKLKAYSWSHLDIINYVSTKARVFIPGRPGITTPEPDLAAFHGFPLDRPFGEVRWQDVSPVLVAEVLSHEDPDKDLIRNVQLYLLVPSIKEYWVLDGRENAERPTMRVHCRRGKKWRILDLAYGDTYTTKLLPGFELKIDPRS